MSIETNSDLFSVLVGCSTYSFQLDDMPQDCSESSSYSSEQTEPEPFQWIVASSAAASDSGSDSDSRSFEYDLRSVLKCRKDEIDRIGAVIKAYQSSVQSISNESLYRDFEEKWPIRTICFPRSCQGSSKWLSFFFSQSSEAKPPVLRRSAAFLIEYTQPQ